MFFFRSRLVWKQETSYYGAKLINRQGKAKPVVSYRQLLKQKNSLA